jgi:intracellular sulfur oxidation DsrE/DsrF family protein
MFSVGRHAAVIALAALPVAFVASAGAASDGVVCWADAGCQPLSTMLNKAQAASAAKKRVMVKATAPTKPAQKASAETAVPPRQAAPVAHTVAIQVDARDSKVMDLALNNARNVLEHYKAKGESAVIELVAYGPGLHMLREDTSPVKERIAAMSLQYPNLAFIACGNTQANQSKAEGKPVTLLSEAKVTPSGVVRLMELQFKGYAYIRP